MFRNNRSIGVKALVRHGSSQAKRQGEPHDEQRKFAVVTGASTGIGCYLAKERAEHGCDLLIAADEPQIEKPFRICALLAAR